VLSDIESSDNARCKTIPMKGLTEAEAREFWAQSELQWEDAPAPPEAGADRLGEVLVTNLGGYALPISLLAGLIRQDTAAAGSFVRWKASLDTLARRDSLHTWSVDACVLWVVHQVLDKVDIGSLSFRILSHVLGEANATDYPSLRQEFISSDPVGAEVTDATLDRAIDHLRSLKILGRDAHGYRYELHPLVRRAIQSFDPDTRVSVKAFLEEARSWIKENEPEGNGLVSLALVEALWVRVAQLVQSHAPRAAVELFEDLDSWIRYRTPGNVVSLRQQYLLKLEQELCRAQEFLAASERGENREAPSDRTINLKLSLQRVRAWMADNLLLADRIDDAYALASQQPDDELARLVVAHCHASRMEFELAFPEYHALALQGTTTSVARWAACGYATCLSQCGHINLATRVIAKLRQRFGTEDADVEFARLQVGVAVPDMYVDEILRSVEVATRDRLLYGFFRFRSDKVQLTLDRRLAEAAPSPDSSLIRSLIDEARAAGFLDVVHQAQLLHWRTRIGHDDDQILASDAESLLADAHASGDRQLFAETVAQVAPVLARTRGLEHATSLVLEALAMCRTSYFEHKRFTRSLQGVLLELGVPADDPRVLQAVREPYQSSHASSESELESAVIAMAAESTGLPPRISNTAGWTHEQVTQKLEEVKSVIDWANTTGSARKWWEAFESENRTRWPLVLRLAEELAARKATITNFFLAYAYSNTENIQANLYYLDYTRLKKEEEQRKKEAAIEALRNPSGADPRAAPEELFPHSDSLPPGITDTRGWSDEQVRQKLEEVKTAINWANTTGSARKLWEDFESENIIRWPLVLRLAEELAVRKATITDFYLARSYSGTDSIQANLSYLDYTRLKREEERKKKEKAAEEIERRKRDA
jgi:hypothetical protein